MSYQYNDPKYGYAPRGQDPNYGYGPQGNYPPVAAAAQPTERAAFIRRTYAHLAGAILAFVLLQLVFFGVTTVEMRAQVVMTLFGNPISVLLLLGGVIGVGMLAQWWANSQASIGMQYAGLGLYVVLQAILIMPLLVFAADYVPDGTLIPTAGILTGIVFGGLTLGVFVTGKDFSFLGGFLWIAGFLALGLIVCAILFNFPLGMWFSAAMIGLASCYILYDTSNVMRHYRTDQHVAASLALFASVAMLFFWILRLLLQSRNQ